MAERYFIGEKHRQNIFCRLVRVVLALSAILLAASLWFHFTMLSQVRALTTNAIGNRLEALANEKAYRILGEGGYTYGDFITLTYDANGLVRSASVDTVGLNLLKMQIATEVLTSLCTQKVTVSIPVGNLLGFIYFSGKGEEVAVTPHVSERMHARIHSAFTTSGINQTHHSIGLSLDFSAVYLLSTGTETLSFSIDIPIGETLIVGEVPDSLTQINRFTDEISEIEIDDAVDFGNSLS